jgi:kynurenine formamidase
VTRLPKTRTGVVPDAVLAAVQAGVEIYDLGRPLVAGTPQSSHHPSFQMVIPRRHGDIVRRDGSSAANDLFTMGSHVGTHIDALSHISFRGHLHGGVSVEEAQSQLGFSSHGTEEIDPIVTRGLLLDIPAALGIESCPAAYEVTTDDLQRALELTGVTPMPGDVLLLRTGWGMHYEDTVLYEGETGGAPGPGEAAAAWLAEHEPRAVGSDTIAFDYIPADTPDFILPAHRILIVEQGINIIEVLDLERLARDEMYTFTFVLSPLKLVGATGSPVRPLALLSTQFTP